MMALDELTMLSSFADAFALLLLYHSEVFKCQHKVSKDIVALKKLRPDVEKNGV
jgi:hypothetical protein